MKEKWKMALTFLFSPFKWCYQENGTIYSSEMKQERLRVVIDTIASANYPLFLVIVVISSTL